MTTSNVRISAGVGSAGTKDERTEEVARLATFVAVASLPLAPSRISVVFLLAGGRAGTAVRVCRWACRGAGRLSESGAQGEGRAGGWGDICGAGGMAVGAGIGGGVGVAVRAGIGLAGAAARAGIFAGRELAAAMADAPDFAARVVLAAAREAPNFAARDALVAAEEIWAATKRVPSSKAIQDAAAALFARANCGAMTWRAAEMYSRVDFAMVSRQLEDAAGDSTARQGAPADHGRASSSAGGSGSAMDSISGASCVARGCGAAAQHFLRSRLRGYRMIFGRRRQRPFGVVGFDGVPERRQHSADAVHCEAELQKFYFCLRVRFGSGEGSGQCRAREWALRFDAGRGASRRHHNVSKNVRRNGGRR